MQHPSGIIISSRPDLALRAIDSPEWHWGNSSEQAAYKTGDRVCGIAHSLDFLQKHSMKTYC